MIHTTTSFQVLVDKYAKSVGAKYVTFSGTTAFTDSKRVNLPAVCSGAILTPEQFNLLSGYIDHELGHVRFTDFSILDAFKSNPDRLLHSITNIIEDVRIENLTISKFPGSRKYLDFLAHTINAGGAPPTQFNQLYDAIWLHRGFSPRTAPSLKPQIKSLTELVPQCSSTTDALDLAKKIRSLLPDGEAIGEATGEATPGEATPGEASADGGLTAAQIVTQLIKSLNDGTDTIDTISTGKVALPPLNPGRDKIFVPSDENLPQYVRDRATVQSQILSLKKSLTVYLMSRAKKSWLRGLDEGTEIDETRLHEIAIRSPSVFKSPHERQVTDTALQLMLDCSTSINSTVMRQAAIMISEALGAIPKIKLSIAGFYGTISHDYVNREGVGRISPLTIHLYKDFDTPYPKARARLGAISSRGVTPLGDAYGKALERIILRPESRQIIWLLTDGEPAFTVGDYHHSDFVLMEHVHKRCVRAGVETLGLEIECIIGIDKYVDRAARISSISTLPQALLTEIRQIIKLR